MTGPSSRTVADAPRRLAAWLLDAVICGIVFAPLNPTLYSSRPSVELVLALFVATMAVLFGYLIAFDGGRRGATPGKRVAGIRVADAESGGPIGYRRAALRRVVYLLGGLPFYAGWLWLFTNPRRQTWHDRAARTVVVRTR